MLSSTELEKVEFSRLQLFGILLGGLLPSFIFLIFEDHCQNLLVCEKEYFYISGLLLAIFTISLYAAHMNRKKEIAWHKKARSFLLTIQVLGLFLYLHFLVMYSGGPRSSVFTMSYIYIIGIVVHIYGTKNWVVVATGALLLASFIINILYTRIPESHFNKLTDTVADLNVDSQQTTNFMDSVFVSHQNDSLHVLIQFEGEHNVAFENKKSVTTNLAFFNETKGSGNDLIYLIIFIIQFIVTIITAPNHQTWTNLQQRQIPSGNTGTEPPKSDEELLKSSKKVENQTEPTTNAESSSNTTEHDLNA